MWTLISIILIVILLAGCIVATVFAQKIQGMEPLVLECDDCSAGCETTTTEKRCPAEEDAINCRKAQCTYNYLSFPQSGCFLISPVTIQAKNFALFSHALYSDTMKLAPYGDTAVSNISYTYDGEKLTNNGKYLRIDPDVVLEPSDSFVVKSYKVYHTDTAEDAATVVLREGNILCTQGTTTYSLTIREMDSNWVVVAVIGTGSVTNRLHVLFRPITIACP